VPQRPRSERAASGPPPAREGGPQRIAKLLARAGVASRREIERMIAEGRVALNGETLTTPATLLETLLGVTVDGKPVRPAAATRLFRFYKPEKTITAERDPRGRHTIYDKLPAGLPRVMPVGRLDFMTEGLLLLTNDGELKRKLELPRTAVVRTYRARAHGQVTQAQLEDLADGITIEGIHYGSINANLERRTGSNCWIEMSLTEGKNREVRRVLAHLGLQVSRLIRVTYGPLTLEGLEPGEAEEVSQATLDTFAKSLK
jgi:23S rRNA pseudouridine2605 synthase